MKLIFSRDVLDDLLFIGSGRIAEDPQELKPCEGRLGHVATGRTVFLECNHNPPKSHTCVFKR